MTKYKVQFELFVDTHGDMPPPDKIMEEYLINRLDAIFGSAPIGDPRSDDTPEVALVHLTMVEKQ
jgi:hypothetical protein